MPDPRSGQLSPQQARTIWRLASSGRTSDMDTLRKELAALAPGWGALTQRNQENGR